MTDYAHAMSKILIVDDQAPIRKLLRLTLGSGERHELSTR